MPNPIRFLGGARVDPPAWCYPRRRPFTGGEAVMPVAKATPVGGPHLLVGDETTSYATADQTGVGRIEAYRFVAVATGTVSELSERTNSAGSTNVTSVVLGIYTDNAGLPGNVLGQGTAPGAPPPSSWITVTGLAIPVVKGTTYWLAHLPLGVAGGFYRFSVANAGGGDVESVGTFTKLESGIAEWAPFNEGPIGFRGIGE